jgi:hypothetical protein
LAGLLTLWALSAQARSESVLHYTKAQTFSSALRYLRVDLGYSVTEKDPEAAYLMFEFPRSDQKKLGLGTIEIVETDESVRLVVRIPELPEYQERMMADGLLSKLKNEHGEPPPRKPQQPEGPKETPPAKRKEGAAGAPKSES